MNARIDDIAPAAGPPVVWRESTFERPFLGGPSWRLSIRAGDAPETLVDALSGLRAEAGAAGVALLSCRVAADHADASAALERAGFRRVERLLTFRRPIKPLPDIPRAVDDARPDDRDACLEIARTSFATDRFHADPLIDDARADALKARWAANDLDGRAARALVVRDGGETCGFVFCLDDAGDAVIDLIAVARERRRGGFGAALVAGALARARGRATTMRVGTQAANAGSIALYRKLGFELCAEALTYHLLPSREAP